MPSLPAMRFTLAFEYVLARGIGPSTLRELDILAQASGGRGMVGGQVRDIAGNIKTYEDLIEIYRKKLGHSFVQVYLWAQLPRERVKTL